MYENEIEYTVTVEIDGVKVHSYMESLTVLMSEESYCNDITINFNKHGWDLFKTLCNPHVNAGQERIVVTVNSVEHKFLLEKRISRADAEERKFYVWGRSKAATLDQYYSLPITDDETESNPWQTANMRASSIINYLLTGTGITVDFRIDDFTVYPEAFSVENEVPIDIINRLAKVPGGRVRSGRDGNLIIDYKEFSTNFVADDPSEEYTDVDEIIQVDEEVVIPPGYNKVRVTGYDELAEDADKSIKIERVDTGCIEPGQEFRVKVYTSPTNLDYTFDTTIGTFFHIGEYTEQHSETIFFTDGAGNTQYPIYSVQNADWHGDDLGAITYTAGFDSIITAEETFGVLEISYTAKYTLYGVIINESGGAIVFAEENLEDG